MPPIRTCTDHRSDELFPLSHQPRLCSGERILPPGRDSEGQETNMHYRLLGEILGSCCRGMALHDLREDRRNNQIPAYHKAGSSHIHQHRARHPGQLRQPRKKHGSRDIPSIQSNGVSQQRRVGAVPTNCPHDASRTDVRLSEDRF